MSELSLLVGVKAVFQILTKSSKYSIQVSLKTVFCEKRHAGAEERSGKYIKNGWLGPASNSVKPTTT